MEAPGLEQSRARRNLRKKSYVTTYNENFMDDLMEEQLGSTLKKKSRTKEGLEKETETEALIALSVGFPIDALHEEEIQAGVVRELGGPEQNDYIVVRNHILARWRRNVRMWLTKEQIRETVSSKYEHLISAAYDFLLYNGYINFGILQSFASSMSEKANQGSVLIVGAGLAGLAAARQLMSFGFKVFVLEARNRPGGRVYTQKVGTNCNFAAAELGGSVITGLHANPLGVLARQLSIPLHKVRNKCPLYGPDGAPVNKKIDSMVEFIFNRLLDKVAELRQVMGSLANNISLGTVLEALRQLYFVARTVEEKQLLDWHLANLEYANAGCLSSLSAAYWDQDDPYEMGGDHCFLAGGNWRLIKALSEGIPILYGKRIDVIRYEGKEVEVVSGSHVFKADMVLCTVPLGVLKQRVIKFEPELPKRKLAAIDRLGFGLLNKVAMVFPFVFWGEDQDTFGCLSENSTSRGEFFLFYSYHTVSGGPVLIALVAGEAALTFEKTEPSVLLHRVLKRLRGIFGPKGIVVPNPVQTICTRWGCDPLSYGSYSHVRVRSSGKDYDILAEHVRNRLFFAGEATTRQYPATMHGAYLSGLREASKMLRAVKSLYRNLVPPVPRNLGTYTDLLSELFIKPDSELTGKFLFVFNPMIEDSNSMGIMRISFDNLEEASKKHLTSSGLELYAILSRGQAQELLKIRAAETKLSYLTKTCGLSLMGQSALIESSHHLITTIANARKVRGKGRFISYQHSL